MTPRVTVSGGILAVVRSVEVRLLGRPQVVVGGQVVRPPRGTKSWGLLAYLSTTEANRSRAELAELLFATAEDPLGALRWNLAALRRLLELPDAMKGDPVRLELPEGWTVDVRQLVSGDPVAALEPDRLGDLLDGMTFSDCPLFETWLLAERRRLGRVATSLLREAALAAHARGDQDRAIGCAVELVRRDPFDEGQHALLIRAHGAAGDPAAARRQFETCQRLLRAELGTEPGPAVVAALRAAESVGRPSTAGSDEVLARLAVAWQSFLAGTVDHALDVMRGAVAIADGGDDVLQAGTRIFLGAMLGMAVRGWDEAVAVLTEAHHIARRAGLSVEAATALGVRSGVEMMRSDYASARRSALAGLALSDDPGARALNLTFLSATEADTGDVAAAVEHARSATAVAGASGDPVRVVYASAHRARIALLCRDVPAARSSLEMALTAGQDALALKPWLLAMLAETELAEGRLAEARSHAEEAESLAAVTTIAYQQALAARVIGLVAAAAGDAGQAVTRLTEALLLARRTNGDGYPFHWPVAFVLDSLVDVTAPDDPPASRRWAAALADHATATGMQQFAAKAREVLSAAPAEPTPPTQGSPN